MRLVHFGLALFLAAPVLADEQASPRTVYKEHRIEVIKSLSGRMNATRFGNYVFASGSAVFVDQEDKEHAIGVATLEAEAALLEVVFAEIAWPERIPLGLRWELWSYYRAQTHRFSISRAETVEIEEGDGILLVIVGVDRSFIDFGEPSYRDLVQLIE